MTNHPQKNRNKPMRALKIVAILFFFQCHFAIGQSNIYDFIKLGKFKIAYQDSLVYDSKYEYEAFGYKGKKPLFVQIWYPISSKLKQSEPIQFKDFFVANEKTGLISIQKELNRHYAEAITRDCLSENLNTGDSLEFGNYTYSDILNSIKVLKTNSYNLSNSKRLLYPVIVYHHGAQSFSFENYLMAEYFASRGYIFVSANFHLPYEDKDFGLKPFDKIIKNEEEESLKSIITFAKSLSSNNSVFFIGHSWGAQMGLRTLDNDNSINGFVSLETTIEYKEDIKRIEELWPEVYNKISIEKTHYPYPMLLCAATGKEETYTYFKNVKATQLTFAPTKKEFEHNAYTSVFYLRYFINPKIVQTDKDVLLDRLIIYTKHLELMNNFFEDILMKKNKAQIEIKFVK